MTLVLLFISVCFLSFANGASDNFKGVASLYGSGAASYRVALGWATLATLALDGARQCITVGYLCPRYAS